MKIAAGSLDRRIELLARGAGGVEVVSHDANGNPQDASGEIITTYGTIATVYAQRLELRTQDAARAHQRDAYATARYLIRYRTGVTTVLRARVDGILYDVVAVDEPDRRRTLVLTLEEAK